MTNTRLKKLKVQGIGIQTKPIIPVLNVIKTPRINYVNAEKLENLLNDYPLIKARYTGEYVPVQIDNPDNVGFIDDFEGMKEAFQNYKYVVIANEFLMEVYNDGTLLTGKLMRMTKRARGHNKQLAYYKYRDIDQMVDSTKERLGWRLENKKKKANEKKAVNDNYQKWFDAIEIGTMLVSTWGYGQTNVYFYQIIGKTKATLKIREICGETVEGSQQHGDSDRVKPIKDAFVKYTVPMTKKPRFQENGAWTLKGRCGNIRIYNKGEEGQYRSWCY